MAAMNSSSSSFGQAASLVKLATMLSVEELIFAIIMN
jgi:hypothetical protein